MLESITPLILTHDEEANLPRTLDRLRWASRIVVMDSGSTDATLSILARHPQAVVIGRPFDSFAGQCNAGLREVRTPWVLSMDADYVLSEEFVAEIRALDPPDDVSGYAAAFRYCVNGRPLRGSLYPSRVVLYRRDRARYEDDGHAHHVIVDGRVLSLGAPIDHDDRKPAERWLANQDRYADLEVEKLLAAPARSLGAVDRLRRLGWLVPLVTPAYCLLWKGLLLDGRAGLEYTRQRTYAETLLARKLRARRRRQRRAGRPD